MKIIQKLTFLLIIALLLLSCNKDEPTVPKNEIDVSIKNTEDYKFDFNISGDEEGATIIIQAKHFQLSELIRDSSTNWSVVYYYQPEINFVGTDFIEIETCTGGDGMSCSNVEIVRINFTIRD